MFTFVLGYLVRVKDAPARPGDWRLGTRCDRQVPTHNGGTSLTTGSTAPPMWIR
jgi:hypothetical protein